MEEDGRRKSRKRGQKERGGKRDRPVWKEMRRGKRRRRE